MNWTYKPDKPFKPRYNLTKNEREAIENLKKRTDIVILNADKGGAVVIQDVKEYIDEANRQLSDKTFYKKCSKDLTNLHNKKINDAITEFQKSNVLSNKVANMLKTDTPKTPKFCDGIIYFLIM